MKTILRLQFVVLLWGFTGVVGKLISIQALPLVFWRMLIATGAIYFYLRLKGISIKVNKGQITKYLFIGCIIGLHWITFFAAIKVSNVSVALSTLATGSLFTAFLEPLFFKKRIVFYEILLSLIIVLCLLLIFKTSPQYKLGIALGVTCSFLSALFSVLNGLLVQSSIHLPKRLMFYEMLGGFLLVTLVLFFTDNINSINLITKVDLLWLFVLGVLLTAYPMIESVQLLKHVSPYTLLLSINLEPIYGIILAFLIFGDSEKMSPTFYFSTIIMIGVLVINGILKSKTRR